MKKYSVLTFIFGDYECLHDVYDVNPEVEYICITDNKKIKSNTWKIIYNDINPKYTSFRKVLEVRYNPFKYVSTDICLIIDGSIQIVKFPIKLISFFNVKDYDIASLIHPDRDNVITEIDTWKKIRNLSKLSVDTCKNFVKNINYDPNYKGLFQTGMILVKKSDIILKCFNKILQINNMCSYENDTFRVDQITFSIILNAYYAKTIKLLPISSYELYGKYFNYCMHNSNRKYHTFNLTNAKIDYKYVFNKLTECYFIDNLQYNNDITAAICNFNTTQLTNNVIDNILKYSNIKKIVVLDNSDKEKFKLNEKFSNNVFVIDNTKQKYIKFDELLSTYKLTSICKNNNFASLKHCMSIQFLLNICTSKYLLLCDSDIIIKKQLDFIEDNFITVSDIEMTNTSSENMNMNCGKSRFTPFIQLFNVKMMNNFEINYFDQNRIHGIDNGILYDTGASLFEDVMSYRLPYKKIRNSEYITHLGHGSWK